MSAVPSTDLDTANGARGHITDIVLDPREPPVGTGPVIELHYSPLYMLLAFQRTRIRPLPGLPPSVIPIEPISKSFMAWVTEDDGQRRRSCSRRQFPITAAYAFTDYRAQGQTMSPVIVDLTSPPGRRLSLFNDYVSLSRSSGRENIRVLRPFDTAVLKQRPNEWLLNEELRLDTLNEATKRWWAMRGSVDHFYLRIH